MGEGRLKRNLYITDKNDHKEIRYLLSDRKMRTLVTTANEKWCWKENRQDGKDGLWDDQEYIMQFVF